MGNFFPWHLKRICLRVFEGKNRRAFDAIPNKESKSVT
jgi:hypothetical protein